MVDGVELHLLDEVQQMREFEGDDALVLQDLPEARHEVADVGHMRQDVVGRHQVRPVAARRQQGAGLLAEEHHLGGNAAGDRRPRGVGRGLDAQDGDVHFDEMLQQVAVVARHLDDQRFRTQAEPLGHG